VFTSHPAFRWLYESKVYAMIMLAAVLLKNCLGDVPDRAKDISRFLAELRQLFELWYLVVNIREEQRDNMLSTMANSDSWIERLEDLASILDIACSVKKNKVNDPW
jgi:hypothetical protein